MSYSGKRNTECLDCKEELYWNFIEVYKYICLTLYNQINLGYNLIYNLLDYGNEYIEHISVKEGMARNSFLVINSSIDENANI